MKRETNSRFFFTLNFMFICYNCVMNKKLLLSIVIILVAIVLVLGIKFNLHIKLYELFNKSSKQELPDVPNAKSYSINGIVKGVNNNQISIDVSRLVAGSEGNYLINENKLVKLTNATVIQFTAISNGEFIKSPADIGDIKVGEKIVLYSSQNIARMNEFSPDRIDIPRI